MSEPFDFEAFIAGAKLAEDTFHLYLVDHGPAIARLQADVDKARAVADDREASVDGESVEKEREVERLIAEMEGSRRSFTLRALNTEEFKRTADDDTDVFDQLAIQAVKPVLDRDQWKRISDVVGATQFGRFVAEANGLAMRQVVVPDFSPTVSTSQDLRESSLS